jgi:hypothetical protein
MTLLAKLTTGLIIPHEQLSGSAEIYRQLTSELVVVCVTTTWSLYQQLIYQQPPSTNLPTELSTASSTETFAEQTTKSPRFSEGGNRDCAGNELDEL